LIREAEKAVVRNAQLEIENSQLNRSMSLLKSELVKRESQIFVVQKAGVGFKDATMGGPASTLSGYAFPGGVVLPPPPLPDPSVAIVPLVIEAMKQFPANGNVQDEGIRTLGHLATGREDLEGAGRMGGVELVMRGMREWGGRTRMQAAGAKLLWRMAGADEGMRGRVVRG
ncbi:hypothetical protein TrRE_jg400, partial [Triparma retinervis]